MIEWPQIVVPFLPVQGMALFPFILLKTEENRKNAVLLNHEKIHIRQQLELLVLPFYVMYLSEYTYHRISGKPHREAYLSISFEKEAFDKDSQPEYLRNRPFAAFVGYMRRDSDRLS